MKIVEKLDKFKHWKQVYQLIRTQLQDIIPYHSITDQEIKTIIQNPNHYIDLKFGVGSGKQRLYFMLMEDEVIAASQLYFPREEQTVEIYWFVGKQKYQNELNQFVAHIKKSVYAQGKKGIGSTRNPFGLGWFGCALSWKHLTKSLLVNDIQFNDYWVNYILNSKQKYNSIDQSIEARPNWNKKERKIEFGLFVDNVEVGEINVWFPTSLSVSLSSMATIEYIEIKNNHRQQGLAEAGIKYILKQLPYISTFMLWTEPDNLAMRKTAEKVGFQQGHTMAWYQG